MSTSTNSRNNFGGNLAVMCKCKPRDPVILIDVDPRETCYLLFIAELFVVTEIIYMSYNRGNGKEYIRKHKWGKL